MYYGILDGTDGSNATNDNVNLVSNRSTEGNDWNPEKSDMPNTLAGYTICCQFKLTGLNCSNNAPDIQDNICRSIHYHQVRRRGGCLHCRTWKCCCERTFSCMKEHF